MTTEQSSTRRSERFHALLATGWTTAYPTLKGRWTVAGPQGWAALDPETMKVTASGPESDDALPGLAKASLRGTMTNYRVGRRAVVSTGTTFIKVVRPRRITDLLEKHRLFEEVATDLCGSHIREVNFEGTLEVFPADGTSLHLELQRSSAPSVARMIRLVARSLAALHSVDVPAGTPELAEPDPGRWLQVISRAELDAPTDFIATAESLPKLDSQASRRLVHGDMHDKNLYVTETSAQFIDLDGVGRGCPEDDVANLAVHLELRAMQGRLRVLDGHHAHRLLVDSYAKHRGLDSARLHAAEAHTWFRLACIYRFRSGPTDLSSKLLERAYSVSTSSPIRPGGRA